MNTPTRAQYRLATFALLAMLHAHTLYAGANNSLNLAAASSQYVSVAASPSLTPTPLTFEAWVYPTTAKCNTIISRGDGGNANTDYIFQVGYNGTTCGVMNIGFFGAGAWDSSTSFVQLNTWTHVAVTFDGTNKQFYINGVLDRTAARTGSLYQSGSAMYIGRQGASCNCNFFQGGLAELRIWNTVRSSNQISADMNISTTGSQPGLVAYYHFNEGGGTTANDITGDGHTGTLTNGASWAGSAPPFLGAGTRVEGPASGTDSVVLSDASTWTAKTNAPWLHLSAASQSGTGSTNILFSFDANPGATRTGTLTIASQTLTVTQAGANFVAASPLTTLVSSGLNNPNHVAVDGAGNVYIVDTDNNAIKEWVAASNSVVTLVSSGLNQPYGVAVDGVGNVYIADTFNNAIKKWVAASNAVTTLVSSGLSEPHGVAVDGAGNVYIADSGDEAIKEWMAASHSVTTLVSSGFNLPWDLAVDAAGNVYIADYFNKAVEEWVAASNTLVTLAGVNYPDGIAVDGAGNVYIAFLAGGGTSVEEWVAASKSMAGLSSSLYDASGVAVDSAGNVYFSGYIPNPNQFPVQELPVAFVGPINKVESAAAGGDSLMVLPATENLLTPFAPTNSPSWLTMTGVTNGLVNFAFTNNFGAARTAYITLLGQQIQITQSAASISLGATNRLEGPAAGVDSVVLAAQPPTVALPWTATTNVPWLHLGAASQSGAGSTNLVFSFDANLGPTRTGTLTIAGLTLTVTQAGSTYVAATPLTNLVSAGLNHPGGVAVDSAGNVYMADTISNAVKEWSVANNTVTALVSAGLNGPNGVAVDAAGNVYIADTTNNAIKEWSVANNTVTTLISSGLNQPSGLAVDSFGNVYIADTVNNAIKEWSVVNNSITALVSSLSRPRSVAVDAAGNVYIADTGNSAIKEWSAASQTVTTLVSSGLSGPGSVAVDAAGNVYIADTGDNALKEWSATSQTVTALISSGLNSPLGATVDGLDNLYIADAGSGAIKERAEAFVDPTPKSEGAAAGSDVLPTVLPAIENLLPPFAPGGSQSWLTVTGVTNGVVAFAVTNNPGAVRMASITLLGQQIPVTQSAASISLGATNRLESPAAGMDDVVLTVAGFVWSATANASWLHLNVTNQNVAGRTNVIFSFDANPGVTRAGTLTIGGITVTVTQAGSTYVPAGLTTLVSSGLYGPESVAVDGAGNVYIADSGTNAIREWVAASNSVITLVTNGLNYPDGVAVDAAGNVYIADTENNAIKEWVAASNSVVTLVSSGLNQPTGVAVDGAGNVYISDYGNGAIEQWVAASNTVITRVSGLLQPGGMAVDGAGNVYVADTGHSAIKEWSVANNTVMTLVSSGLLSPFGLAVDGAGNVYIADAGHSAIKEWLMASNTVTTLVSSGLNSPFGVAVDGTGNVYVADTDNSAIKELPHTFLDPTPKFEGLGAGSDALPVVVPATQNLQAQFAPTSSPPWLTITGVTNGVVSFAFTSSTTNRVGSISLLSQNIPVTQYGYLLNSNLFYVGPAAGSNSVVLTVNPTATQAWTASSQAAWLHLGVTSGSGSGVVSFTYDVNPGPTRSGTLTIAGQTLLIVQEAFALGVSVRLEGNTATTDSVVLASLNSPWTATANASWLHLSASNQSGTGSTNVFFTVDANTNATRTGTLTIAGLALTVTQAGVIYIPAPAPVTTLVSNRSSSPYAVAVDGSGNVYIADANNAVIDEWSAASNTVTTLPIPGLQGPTAVALDGSGNVYVADDVKEAIYEWSSVSNALTTLPFSGLNFPTALAVDGLGNLYVADQNNAAIYEWSPAYNTVTTLLTNGLSAPDGVAVDVAGNVYIADVNHKIMEWSATSHAVTTLFSGTLFPGGLRVDGAGNIFYADFIYNTISKWSASSHAVTTLVSSGLSSPQDVAVDAMDNIYIADSNNGMIKELPRAFVDPTAKMESPAAGSDTLPVVLPVTEDLLAPFAPTNSQPWLSITRVANGVVSFAFTANTGGVRLADITLLGKAIAVTQSTLTVLVNPIVLSNGMFQFAFTNAPGGSYTILSTTNLALPLNSWTPVGAPMENPPGNYVFTAPPATNSQSYYTVRSP